MNARKNTASKTANPHTVLRTSGVCQSRKAFGNGVRYISTRRRLSRGCCQSEKTYHATHRSGRRKRNVVSVHTVDPIPELAALAAEHNIGCHVDACIGGFVLPFLERLGYKLPPWDFRVPGVTEISADVHKYGYANKGSSVILHRDSDWVGHQFFMFSDWPSGLYGTPAVPGARPATSMATAWAVMQHLGIDGYTELVRQAMDTTLKIQQSIQAMPELYIVGRSVGTTFAFGAHALDIHRVGDWLSDKGWHLDRNVEPPSLHMMVSPGHRLVADQFIADLQQAVAQAK